MAGTSQAVRTGAEVVEKRRGSGPGKPGPAGASVPRSEASLRINESLDFGTVLRGVLDSARSLTGARYGVITLLDDAGRFRTSSTPG